MNVISRYINNFLYPYRFTRTRTVRYAFPAIALVASLLSVAAITSSQATTVRFVSSQTVVSEGDRFSLQVIVDAVKPINAVDLSIALPQHLVEVVSLDEGESVITIWTEAPNYKNGMVHLRGGTFRKGFVGTHQIITIELRAKTSGVATVALDDVQLLAGDGSGNEVPVASTDVMTEVKIATANSLIEDNSPEKLEGVATLQIVTDIDGDGEVSLQDVTNFMSAWQNKNRTYDFNGDGRMTFHDFAIILADSFLK